MQSYRPLDTDAANDMYQEGVRLLAEYKHDPDVCESILYPLMVLFPHRPELLYFQGCICTSKTEAGTEAGTEGRTEGRTGGDTFPRALVWFQLAFHAFYQGPPESWNRYHIENLLDMCKGLFDRDYTDYLHHLMESHPHVFDHLKQPPCDPRWLVFLGAFYIKTNRLMQADAIYSQLLQDTTGTRTKNMNYNIYNNSLILYTRMANFNRIPNLLRRNFEICHSMVNDPLIEFATKKNVFCSNMLQYDYMYYSAEDRRELCKYVDTYFPVSFYVPQSRGLGLGGGGTSGSGRTGVRVRIGYVSSDFVEHAVSHFILPILQHHDTQRFDVTLFATKKYETIMSHPFYADNCRRHRVVDLQHLSTEACAARIRELDIHILVDLNGYTQGHRLDVFAHNPAPIQVAYLGFPNSVGSANVVRYRITDPVADRPDSQQWFAEQRLYMRRRGFLLYQPVVQSAPLPFLGGDSPFFPWVVLGAVNRESKNSSEVMECWRNILLKAHHTKILIKLSTVEDDEIHRAKYREALRDIAPDRILFCGYGTLSAYFQLYSMLHVVLDTFPYSGTTTTCNALYNSVPVVTMAHRDLHAHNVSASLLTHCGLSEFVTHSPEEYVNRVVELVADAARLQGYRGGAAFPGTVHHKFVEAMQPAPFMEEYEGVYRELWGSYQDK